MFRPAPAGLAASAVLLSLLAAPRPAHALPFELKVPAAAAAADSVQGEAEAMPVGTQREHSRFFRKLLAGGGALAAGAFYAVTRADGATAAPAAAVTSTPVAPLGANPVATLPAAGDAGTTSGASTGNAAGNVTGGTTSGTSTAGTTAGSGATQTPIAAADVNVLVNPEPSSIALMGAGVAGLLVAARRRRAAH